jgi:hypothetical protein
MQNGSKTLGERGLYLNKKIVNLLQSSKNMLTHPTKKDKTNRIPEMYSNKRTIETESLKFTLTQ